MIRSTMSAKYWWLFGGASVTTLLVAYSWLALRQHAINPADTTIPNWTQLWRGVSAAFSINDVSGERWILSDTLATAYRLAFGLLCGIEIAVAVGIAMGCFPIIEAIFAPPLSLLAKIPPTAALAVLFVLAGTGTPLYVVSIAIGIFPSLAQSVYFAVREVPEELLYKSYTLGADNSEVIGCVIFRHCLPKIMDAIRLQIGPAMVYLIAAEMLCADVGFGYRIRLQSRLLNMSVVYVYLALLAVFGFAADYGLRALRRFCCPWYEPVHS